MLRYAVIMVALLLPGAFSRADPPAFKSLRYDEDYSALADPAKRTSIQDHWKYLPMPGGEGAYLSLGGELRERFETYENEFFRSDPDADNAYLLQRYLLHADYHPMKRLRVFGQLQSSLEDGRPGGPRITDRDPLDVHQFFADVILRDEENGRVTMRAGRQEFSYGSERLISVREGTNSRRAFDAFRLLYQSEGVNIDGFYASPVEVDDEMFDDQNISGVEFWGVYSTLPLRMIEGCKLDVYYLGLDNPEAEFAQGEGREKRHTVGTRFFGNIGAWDFNHEAIYQFGEYGDGTISAWSVATDHGYTLAHVWGAPRLGLKAAIASGDRDPLDEDLQTLNPLFPRGNYFTEASLLGPQNFIDLHPCLRLKPAKEWTWEAGCDFYWRQSLDDGIYTPGGRAIYTGDASQSRFVGTDLSILATWQATRNVSVSASYTHFFAGAFIRENGGQDVNFGMLSLTCKF